MTVDIQLNKQVDTSYKIYIENIQNIALDRRVAIITNPKVSGLHLNYLLSKLSCKELVIITVKDGEEYKNLATIEEVLNNLFNHKFDRKSLLLAFGGGVIGDMTGFAASLFQRGIDFIQIPTTLLSQVDASVGGKTGVNNSFGKNLIGAFYQPKAVYIDPHFLATLPEREYAAGIAEIIKMAVMFDKEFFEWIEVNDLRNQEAVQYAIKRCVELKAWVVSQDEKEAGIRAVLNYGHTFCHVVENESGYGTYLHGEAVSIGMCMANELAQSLNLFTKEESHRVLQQLKKYNLPVTYNVKNTENFYEAFFLDKKSENAKIKFILPKGMGAFEVRDDIAKESVINTLKKFS